MSKTEWVADEDGNDDIGYSWSRRLSEENGDRFDGSASLWFDPQYEVWGGIAFPDCHFCHQASSVLKLIEAPMAALTDMQNLYDATIRTPDKEDLPADVVLEQVFSRLSSIHHNYFEYSQKNYSSRMSISSDDLSNLAVSLAFDSMSRIQAIKTETTIALQKSARWLIAHGKLADLPILYCSCPAPANDGQTDLGTLFGKPCESSEIEEAISILPTLAARLKSTIFFEGEDGVAELREEAWEDLQAEAEIVVRFCANTKNTEKLELLSALKSDEQKWWFATGARLVLRAGKTEDGRRRFEDELLACVPQRGIKPRLDDACSTP